MKAWLAIDDDGTAMLFELEPSIEIDPMSDGRFWSGGGCDSIPFTGELPPIAAGECIEIELTITTNTTGDQHGR